MTPQTTSPESRPEIPTARGSHDTSNYVTVFLAIHLSRLDGVLETSNRRGWRRLFFLEGEVVGFTSSFVQDSLSRALATANVVPKSRLQWFEERLEPDEHLETALLASGAVTPEQLEEQETARIRQGIAAPLRASRGSWQFEPCPGLNAEQVAPGLRPELSSVGALWQGVRQHVAVDKILPDVTDDGLGPLMVGDGLEDLLPALELEASLTFLGEAIGDGLSVEELFKQIPDRSGNLLKLVWMLERGGLLLRADRPTDDNIARRLRQARDDAADGDHAAALLAWARGEEPPRSDDPPSSSGPRVTVRAVPSGSPPPATVSVRAVPPRSRAPDDTSSVPSTTPYLRGARDGTSSVASMAQTRGSSRRASERPLTKSRIAAEHAKRMERDFYGFLGLKPGCPREVVDRRCKRVLARYQNAEDLELEPETERKLGQLLHGLQIVWQTLTNAEHKDEYDRRLEQGKAPKVREIQAALDGVTTAQPADLGPEAHGKVSVSPVPPSDDSVETARILIERGSMGAAAQMLERLRRKEPSSPDVLSELGWAVWRLRGNTDSSEESPEDYVSLALTFAPQHLPALEYHARIAFERGDLDAVQERIDRLLAVDKRNTWALEVLSSDALSASSRRSSGSGLRFWRRKSD